MITSINQNNSGKKQILSFKAINDIRNFKRIDKYVSRGGQPTKEQLLDLQKDGVKHIINFRTLYVPFIDFVEEEEAKKLGIKYVSMPMISNNGPTQKNVSDFFELTEKAKAKNEKVYIHCAWGKDRTG
ncbi:MAG: tyrosine-protein phosphatase, partial [Candidatus Gastranaerophilales bacterium]|nr:tyrosine-protein phosphatase [Candidatus Gastranaerophilales bacterium]